ncbi:MAG: phage head closure protein [Rhodocyclaceae bacterium]|nr:phage head closure protein [Rhodocyclaceae bacterium]
MLQSGKLDKRVSIQQQSSTRDDLNQKVDTWTTLNNGAVWASVQPLRASEAISYDAKQMLLTHRVTIRFRSDVTPDMRLLFGSRILKIVSMRNPDERGELIELLCEEGRDV